MAKKQRATRAADRRGKTAAPTPRRRLPVVGVAAVVAAGALAATILLVHAPAATAQGCAGHDASTGLSAGQCAPNFTLTDLRNRRVSLAALRGHPVLLHFWGVPCTTCRAEYPDFSRAVRQYVPKGLKVVTVESWNSPTPLVQQWQNSHHLPATMLVDVAAEVPQLYGVSGTPTTFFIDSKGRITATFSTPLSYSGYQSNIARIM